MTGRKRNGLALGEVGRGQGAGAFQQGLIRAGKDYLTPLFSSLRAEVDDEVALLDDLRIMLHHHDGIVVGPETMEDLHETVAVPRMQADGRFVEHVECVDQ